MLPYHAPHFAQHGITGVTPEGIGEPLKAIEIEPREGQRDIRPLGAMQLARQALLEVGGIDHPRYVIMRRLIPGIQHAARGGEVRLLLARTLFLLALEAVGDVTNAALHEGLAIGEEQRAHELYMPDLPVLGLEGQIVVLHAVPVLELPKLILGGGRVLERRAAPQGMVADFSP